MDYPLAKCLLLKLPVAANKYTNLSELDKNVLFPKTPNTVLMVLLFLTYLNVSFCLKLFQDEINLERFTVNCAT